MTAARHSCRWSEWRGPARVACGAPYYVGERATHRPRVPGCGGRVAATPATPNPRGSRLPGRLGALVPLTAEDRAELDQAATARDPEARRSRRGAARVEADLAALLSVLPAEGPGVSLGEIDALLSKAGAHIGEKTLPRRLEALRGQGRARDLSGGSQSSSRAWIRVGEP